ncbi:hypothetical protein DFQ27_006261 [Actinomortierella ambigua]|uniref:Uncharacterized protein n=1 Tax=Actinomortierella ambigua TaxID=1343610 RepID=A0A9P6QJC5_9FUNG|nr:hypothetical protein DFQ27_006261 [Actinomortierella ambigua]
MTQLFDAVPTNKLRSLKINGGCYIDHSWKLEMVVQHAVSLVSIELNDMEFTSRTDDKLGIEHLWVYQVLTSCPNLKRLSATPCSWVASKFKMNHLWVEDLLAPWTPQQPQGWVCRGLEEFQVPILGVCRSQEDHYPKEGDCGVEPSGPSQHEACVSLQRRLFLELGKLRRLRVFSLGFERLQSDDIQSMGFPDFAYESGHLQELRSWKQLETFDVAYTHQDLSLSDIDWMVEHWPSLRVVKGLDIQPPRDHSLPREGLEEDIRNKYPSLVVE